MVLIFVFVRNRIYP